MLPGATYRRATLATPIRACRMRTSRSAETAIMTSPDASYHAPLDSKPRGRVCYGRDLGGPGDRRAGVCQHRRPDFANQPRLDRPMRTEALTALHLQRFDNATNLSPAAARFKLSPHPRTRPSGWPCPPVRFAEGYVRKPAPQTKRAALREAARHAKQRVYRSRRCETPMSKLQPL